MKETPRAPSPVRCARCAARFECGAQRADCWCQRLPPLAPARYAPTAGCYCPTCLAALVGDRERAR